jgi:recombinational DNA repair protein (RecF pathway)
MSERKIMHTNTHDCHKCGEPITPVARATILKKTICLPCGEEAAKKVRHTVVPMAKSNYVVVTDLSLLRGLNKYASA